MEPTNDPYEQRRLAGVYYRLHGEKWNFDLGAIPNVALFCFEGLARNGNVLPCVVQKNADKTTCSAFYDPVRAGDEWVNVKVFDQLIAWRIKVNAAR